MKVYLAGAAADTVDYLSDRWETERRIGRELIEADEAARLAGLARYDEIVARQRRQQTAHPLERFM